MNTGGIKVRDNPPTRIEIPWRTFKRECTGVALKIAARPDVFGNEETIKAVICLSSQCGRPPARWFGKYIVFGLNETGMIGVLKHLFGDRGLQG